jgi:hypothetical protein
MNQNFIQKDFIDVLSNLQNHWNVLEEELIEINKDIQYLSQGLKKYGESFRIPLNYLLDLKVYKKNAMKEIIKTMENFSTNVSHGRSLYQQLNESLSKDKFTNTTNKVSSGTINHSQSVFISTKKSKHSPIHYKLISKKRQL